MNKRAIDKSVNFIKSWLAYRHEQSEVPGYVVAISYKGNILLNEAYGYADMEKKEKLTPTHIFRVASHSKTFTATAVMQLQEQGKLRIDDYAVDYLPWLDEHDDKRWLSVTLRQLLSHGAGVIRDGLDADYWQFERPFPNDEQLKTSILEAKLVIDNNTKLKYSNYGYSLLGMVIAAVSGLSYGDYVNRYIIKPLNLHNTGPEYIPAVKDKLVTGYSRRDDGKNRLPIDNIDTQAMAPATGFYSTAEDLCTYFNAQFIGSGELLNNESKKEMQRVQWHAKTPGQDDHEDYGLGYELEYVGERMTFGHGGGFPGQVTKSIADPNNGLTVVVLTNCLESPASAIAKGIFGIIDYFQQYTEESEYDVHRLEGRYANLWTTTEIVAVGKRIIATSSDSWQPFLFPEELEYVNATTLKIMNTDSFFSEGEQVRFLIKGGKVESLTYAGMTMWPADEWQTIQKNRSIVSL